MITYDKNSSELTLCREFSSDIDAQIAETALKQAGIICTIDNQIFSRIYPILNAPWGCLRLMVFGRDLDKANEILDSLNFSDNEL